MKSITDPKINRYLMKLSCESDRRTLEMEQIAKVNDFPIVDRLVGRLLFFLTKIKNPRLVVELGSGYGYSAYWFAKALGKGKVVLTDHDQKNIEYAQKTFRRAGMTSRAQFRVGNAVRIAQEYRKIDILFIDIDKHEYPGAIKKLLPNLNRDALVIADNTLWYGKVTGKSRDRDTQGIKKFNEYMFRNRDFFVTILPLRDGVLLAQKIR